MKVEIQEIQDLQLVFANLTAVMTELITASSQSNNDIIQLIPKIEEAEILTRYETMKLLQVSSVTLHNWHHNKTLPAQKLGGRVYYQKSDIMNKLNSVG
jgi:predicted DNA-binding transcriptional regulator AlpA